MKNKLNKVNEQLKAFNREKNNLINALNELKIESTQLVEEIRTLEQKNKVLLKLINDIEEGLDVQHASDVIDIAEDDPEFKSSDESDVDYEEYDDTDLDSAIDYEDDKIQAELQISKTGEDLEVEFDLEDKEDLLDLDADDIFGPDSTEMDLNNIEF